MAAGFYAHRLQATCIGKVESSSYFNTANAHIVFGTNEVAAPMTTPLIMSSGCSYNRERMSFARFPSSLVEPKAYGYGYNPSIGGGLNEVFYLPPEMYFDYEEVKTKVGPFLISPYAYLNNPALSSYTRLIGGFRWKYPMVNMPLQRKFSNRLPLFKGFTKVNWTDATPDQEQPDLGTDWLGNLFNDGEAPSYPMLYSMGVDEPFLGERFYEDTKSIDNQSKNYPNKSKQEYMHNFAPFCSPIKIYSSKGIEIGYADGLAFQIFVFNAALKNPLLALLDPNMPFGVRKLLPTNLQYWSIEVWTYLSVVKTSTDPKVILKSPRLHTARSWYYTQPIGNGIAPGTPYTFLKANVGPTGYFLNFPLLKNYSNPDLIREIAYEIPWTMAQLYITA